MSALTTTRMAVFDLEANGLNNMVREEDNASRTWCGVFHQFNGRVRKFPPYATKCMLDYMSELRFIAGHNIIDYDLPLLERLYGWTPHKNCEVIDTYLLAQMLWPDLPRHFRCSGKRSPHSLENFGYMYGRPKPVHEDWLNFSRGMYHRCAEDVEINTRLMKEINLEVGFFNDSELAGTI